MLDLLLAGLQSRKCQGCNWKPWVTQWDFQIQKPCNSKAISPDSHPESHKAPNRLQIVREKPKNHDAKRYRQARNQQALYRAASRLWMQGINMSQAVRIVSDAVNEASLYA